MGITRSTKTLKAQNLLSILSICTIIMYRFLNIKILVIQVPFSQAFLYLILSPSEVNTYASRNNHG